jgi:GH43 family beta-xylosidase
MVSIKPETLTIMTPGKSFREGSEVFCRKGIYYFMWSENDTRSPDYRVRYGTSSSPLGKITVPENNLVIEKNVAEGIYGTGHNSVIQIPGTDDWYIVYHRFTYPKGIEMGSAAGFHREVCIDKMEFKADGSIKQVIPTHKGIDAIKVK